MEKIPLIIKEAGKDINEKMDYYFEEDLLEGLNPVPLKYITFGFFIIGLRHYWEQQLMDFLRFNYNYGELYNLKGIIKRFEEKLPYSEDSFTKPETKDSKDVSYVKDLFKNPEIKNFIDVSNALKHGKSGKKDAWDHLMKDIKDNFHEDLLPYSEGCSLSYPSININFKSFCDYCDILINFWEELIKIRNELQDSQNKTIEQSRKAEHDDFQNKVIEWSREMDNLNY